ncbi:MAG TPA: hypothetical protein VHY30_09160, partial [Verrucomicrobiae bacterium]|nr:hypothetical protein [Verrucomicrobiae bacterium]
NRLDDALIVAQTCLKLDPYNGQVSELIKQLQEFKKQAGERGQIQDQLQKLQTEAATNPTNFQNVLALGNLYAQMQDTNRAAELFRQATALFDQELANPNVRPENVTAMAQIAAATGNFPKLESILKKLVSVLPNQPEPLYDLAALDAITGKNDEALKNLRASIDLSSHRLLTNPAARNLLVEAAKDQRFNSIRNLPEFQKLVQAN